MILKTKQIIELDDKETELIHEANDLVCKVIIAMRDNNFRFTEKTSFADVFFACMNGKIVEENEESYFAAIENSFTAETEPQKYLDEGIDLDKELSDIREAIAADPLV